MKLRDLWEWRGTIGQRPYLKWMAVLALVKVCLDYLVAHFVFGQPWPLLNYFLPRQGLPGDFWRDPHATFYECMLALLAPFFGSACVLTLRRLRSAGAASWLVFLLPIAIIGPAFIVCLAATAPPTGSDASRDGSKGYPTLIAGQSLPPAYTQSAVWATLISVVYGAGAVYLSTVVMHEYGWTLFMALPFVLGFAAVMLYGYDCPRKWGECSNLALLSLLLLNLALLAVALEGAFCLVMALPIDLPLAWLGGAFAFGLLRLKWRRRFGLWMTFMVMMVLPVLMGAEKRGDMTPPLLSQRTSIVVNAPVERVWNCLVHPIRLPGPQAGVGIARPLSVEIQGHGAGARFHCVLTTGSMDAPITAWQDDRMLEFSLPTMPDSMQELTPYGNIHPPHVHNFLVCTRGQLLLTELPGGRTRVVATTWYHDHLSPAPYWMIWSNAIINHIHNEVLREVKVSCEG